MNQFLYVVIPVTKRNSYSSHHIYKYLYEYIFINFILYFHETGLNITLLFYTTKTKKMNIMLTFSPFLCQNTQWWIIAKWLATTKSSSLCNQFLISELRSLSLPPTQLIHDRNHVRRSFFILLRGLLGQIGSRVVAQV